MTRTVFKVNKNSTVFHSIIVFNTSTSWAFGLSLSLAIAGLTMGLASPVAAQSTTKPVVSCWATKAGRDDIRVTWTPADIDNANRYTIKRSKNGGSYNWKSTESNQARSSIVRESNSGNLRYRVETISASGTRVFKDCGPNGGLEHDGTSTPVAVASCWATKLRDGSIFTTWTARPDDGADRYTLMMSKNHGDYQWVDTVTRDKRESNIALVSRGTHRFRVRTVASNRAFAVRDCGPGTGVTSRLTIMPIGDSITLGATERPAYRYPMQDDERYKDCGIDLVGGAPTNWARGEAPSGRYVNFDHDHASWGGATVGDLLNDHNILQKVKNHQPDAILLHVGTNDILKQVLLVDESRPNLRTMINGIKQQSPNTLILVAKVTRSGEAIHQNRVDRWNAMVADVVAETGAKTRLVDMDAIWPRLTPGNNNTLSENQIAENKRFELLTMYKPALGIQDGVHPSIDGSKVLADQWLKALNDARLCQ